MGSGRRQFRPREGRHTRRRSQTQASTALDRHTQRQATNRQLPARAVGDDTLLLQQVFVVSQVSRRCLAGSLWRCLWAAASASLGRGMDDTRVDGRKHRRRRSQSHTYTQISVTCDRSPHGKEKPLNEPGSRLWLAGFLAGWHWRCRWAAAGASLGRGKDHTRVDRRKHTRRRS